MVTAGAKNGIHISSMRESDSRPCRVAAPPADDAPRRQFHLPEGLHALHALTFRAGRVARITVFLKD